MVKFDRMPVVSDRRVTPLSWRGLQITIRYLGWRRYVVYTLGYIDNVINFVQPRRSRNTQNKFPGSQDFVAGGSTGVEYRVDGAIGIVMIPPASPIGSLVR